MKRTAVGSLLILTLALSRCSPISPSYYKLAKGGRGGAAPTPSEPIPSRTDSQLLQFRFTQELRSLHSYSTALDASTASHRVSLPEYILDSLRQGNPVSFQLEGSTPREAVALIGLAADESEIHALTEKVKMTLVPAAGNRWTLSLSVHSLQAMSDFQRALRSFTLVFGSPVQTSVMSTSTTEVAPAAMIDDEQG
jgi:hypothetical protein